VAVAAIALALLTSPHIRRHWPGWWATLLLVILLAFAPTNDGYRADVIFAITSGRIHSNPLALLRVFTNTSVEQIIVFGEIIVLLYLITQRHATLGDVLCGLFIWISGLLLLSQNAQTAIIPLFVIPALLVYVRLGDWLQSGTQSPLTSVYCSLTCAILPFLPDFVIKQYGFNRS